MLQHKSIQDKVQQYCNLPPPPPPVPCVLFSMVVIPGEWKKEMIWQSWREMTWSIESILMCWGIARHHPCIHILWWFHQKKTPHTHSPPESTKSIFCATIFKVRTTREKERRLLMAISTLQYYQQAKVQMQIHRSWLWPDIYFISQGKRYHSTVNLWKWYSICNLVIIFND